MPLSTEQEIRTALRQRQISGAAIPQFTYTMDLKGKPCVHQATVDLNSDDIVNSLVNRLEAHRINCLDMAEAIYIAQQNADRWGLRLPQDVALHLDHAASIATSLARAAPCNSLLGIPLPAQKWQRRPKWRDVLGLRWYDLLRFFCCGLGTALAFILFSNH